MAQLSWKGRTALVAVVAVLCAIAAAVSGGSASPRAGTAVAAVPADPLAGPAARSELRWLADLPARESGPRLVSGYFGGYGSGFTAQGWSADGRYPGLIGCDYADVPTTGQPVIDTSCNAQLRAYAAAGGLVTVSVHGPNPAGGPFNSPLPAAQFAQLLNPDTAIGRAWDGQLDEVAAGLRQLTAAGVPVLFRPLLEMNSDAFWWSGQDAAQFRAVWQNMFSYVSARLGPAGHDVLWVWSAGCEPGGANGASDGAAIEGYYPGNAYADVIGADCYTNDPTATGPSASADVVRTYQDLSGFAAQNAKPFAFTEIGGDNADNEAASNVDFTAWLNALHQDYPQSAYFLAWNGPVGPTGANNRNGASLLTDPGVIDRGQLAAQGLKLGP